MDNKELRLKLLVVFSLVGIIDTGYLMYLDFFSLGKTCLIGEGVACGALASYSTFLSVPYSVWGFASYFLLYLTSLSLLRQWHWFNVEHMYSFLLFLALFGFIFSSYLLYLSYFVIEAVCAFCFLSWMLLLLISFLICYDVYFLHKNGTRFLW